MASVVGWYGPLIDLSTAHLHVADFVQLLVFVHRSNPVQYKSWKGGEVVRRDIHVGDDTRPYFPVSLWHNQIGSSMAVSAGEVILLQNVMITKYGDVLEGRTVHCSSVLPLIQPSQSLVSKGLDELVAECRVGTAAKDKLRKVIEWVKQTGSTYCSNPTPCYQNVPFTRNWKLPEERKSKGCVSLSEVSRLTDSCKAVFYASVGEIFLPFTSTKTVDSDKEKMFISRRLYKSGDTSLVTDLICLGCQVCGSPLNPNQGSSVEQDSVPLYCSDSSNRLHVVSFIYKPFMLYVWDESEYLPLLVRNKAAELLFGNVKAEQVYSSFTEKQNCKTIDLKGDIQIGADGVSVDSGSCCLGLKRKLSLVNNMNFHLIWIILLKALLQQGKNSPLKFEVTVNASLDRENGLFEVVSVCMPCFRPNLPLEQSVSLEN